jgi:hypothetical protein
LAATLNTVLASLPLAISGELDPGAVHQQVQRTIGAPVGDLDDRCFLPPTQGRIVRHGPIEVRHLQQARHHACRLPQAQLEQDLDHQTELDRYIGKHRRAAGAPVMRRKPGHVLVQPDQ